MIPISAIASVTFLINQRMKLKAGNGKPLSQNERKELEELRERVHNLEVITSDLDSSRLLDSDQGK
jgi:hypothetical protein